MKLFFHYLNNCSFRYFFYTKQHTFLAYSLHCGSGIAPLRMRARAYLFLFIKKIFGDCNALLVLSKATELLNPDLDKLRRIVTILNSKISKITALTLCLPG